MIEKLIEQQETIKGMQQNEKSLIKIMKMYEDYKLRVDKAIEYIKEGTREDMPNKRFRDEKRVTLNPVLDILKGDDK